MPLPRPASDRALALALYAERRERDLTVAEICRRAGISKATLMRWVAGKDGKDGNEAGGKRAKKTGRPPAHVFTPEECEALRGWRLVRRSLPLAVEDFLKDRACRPETGEYLDGILERAAARESAPQWPACVRRAAHLSEEMKAAWRGPRALAKYAPTVSRGAFGLAEDGSAEGLMAHDVWESDDMSVNEPFRYQDPETGEWLTGRQSLYTVDVCSAAVLGFTLVGRRHDAYRAEDILDHMLDLIDVYGMPREWRIERGIWESRRIDGVPLDDSRARKLGYEGERWAGRRIGGLGHLFSVEHMYSSNGKAVVEGTFNHKQNLSAHASLHVGRERGEFEAEARAVRRAKRRGTEESTADFWTTEEAAPGYLAVCERFNARPKERTMFGGRHLVPAELLRSRGLPPRPLPEAERWRFLPQKQLAVVRRGLISAKVDGVKYTWPALGEGMWLEHGHRVVVAWHPLRPELGATVVEADFGPRNPGRPIGEPIFVAERLEARPQYDLRPAGERDAAPHPAKAWGGMVRREFRAVSGAAKSGLADGRGRAATVETGFDEAARAAREDLAPAPPTDGGREATPRRGAAPVRSTTPALDAEALARLEEDALNWL